MATANSFYLEYDKTGTLLSNKITKEQHVLNSDPIKIIQPLYGVFYTNDIIVYEVNSSNVENILIKNTDYYCSDMMTKETVATGKEICNSVIVVKNTTATTFRVTYQALGGHDSPNLVILNQNMIDLNINNTNIDYSDIKNIPKEFAPSAHKTDSRDMYGMEYFTNALSLITDSIMLPNNVIHDDIQATLTAIVSPNYMKSTYYPDPYYGNQALYIRGDCKHHTSMINDYSSHTHLFVNPTGMRTTNEISHPNGGSIYLNNKLNRGLIIRDSVALDLSTCAEWTIELEVLLKNVPNNKIEISKGGYRTLIAPQWRLEVTPTQLIFHVGRYDNPAVEWSMPHTATFADITNMWKKLAITYIANTYYLFLSGQLLTTATSSLPIVENASDLFIGGREDPANPSTWVNMDTFDGYLKNLLITRDVCKYTTSYVPISYELNQHNINEIIGNPLNALRVNEVVNLCYDTTYPLIDNFNALLSHAELKLNIAQAECEKAMALYPVI